MEILAAASTAYQTGQYLGMATLAAVLVLLVRRGINQDRPPRSRGTDLVAALVVAALLIAGVVRLGGDGDRGDPWKAGTGGSAEQKPRRHPGGSVVGDGSLPAIP
jgi:hypothetical protein